LDKLIKEIYPILPYGSIMRMSDVIVIGGGPSGLILSAELAKKGISVLVCEEHNEVGYPNHCAGLVSINCIKDFMNFSLNEDFILNRVRGAKIYSPTGEIELIVERSRPQAVVLDRKLMDKALYEIALTQGVRVLLNTKVIEIVLKEPLHEVKVNKTTLECQILVDAEGTKFKFVKIIGANSPIMFKDILPAIQAEVRGIKDLDTNYVEIYLGRVWASKFFAWIIPLDEKTARIGLASSKRAPFQLLESFMRHHPRVKDRVTKAKIKRLFAGLVYIGGPLDKTFTTRALLIGDAGGFTKPTTGGGVFTGAVSSRIAARVIELAHDTSNFSYNVFALYEKLWKRALGRELMLMKSFRKLLWSLPDSLLEKLMKYTKELDLSYIVKRYSGVDYQLSNIGFESFLKALLNIIRNIIT